MLNLFIFNHFISVGLRSKVSLKIFSRTSFKRYFELYLEKTSYEKIIKKLLLIFIRRLQQGDDGSSPLTVLYKIVTKFVPKAPSKDFFFQKK